MKATPMPDTRLFTFSAAASVLLFAATAQQMSAQTWQLIWSNEFSGGANTYPDSTKWTYDTGAGGWGNGELQTYCSAGSNTAPGAIRDPPTPSWTATEIW
jgi:hypothetical protein